MHIHSRRGGFLLPTNLCCAACTSVIHFHHLYLCQNIDRYPCRCIPRWRDLQTQTGAEASFFCSAFWRSWHTFSSVYSLLYWLYNRKKWKKKNKKHWQHRRAEENQWNQTGETKWMFFSPSASNSHCFWSKCWGNYSPASSISSLQNRLSQLCFSKQLFWS